jgi:hypothetical protein
MKKYIVEFTHLDGTVEEVTFNSDKIDWSIKQWCRNRHVLDHKIISEGSSNNKQMLFG